MSNLCIYEKVILEILKESETPLTFKQIYDSFKEKRKSSFTDKIPKEDYFRSFIRNLCSLEYVKFEYLKDTKYNNHKPYKCYFINKDKLINTKE